MVWSVAFSSLSDIGKCWVILFLGMLLLGVAYALKKEETIWI